MNEAELVVLRSTEDRILGEFDVDGTITAQGDRLIGKATEQPDGTWLCLADVNGMLVRVEIRISFSEA